MLGIKVASNWLGVGFNVAFTTQAVSKRGTDRLQAYFAKEIRQTASPSPYRIYRSIGLLPPCLYILGRWCLTGGLLAMVELGSANRMIL